MGAAAWVGAAAALLAVVSYLIVERQRLGPLWRFFAATIASLLVLPVMFVAIGIIHWYTPTPDDPSTVWPGVALLWIGAFVSAYLPRKPDQPRWAQFAVYWIGGSVLATFIAQGTADPFGSLAKLKSAALGCTLAGGGTALAWELAKWRPKQKR